MFWAVILPTFGVQVGTFQLMGITCNSPAWSMWKDNLGNCPSFCCELVPGLEYTPEKSIDVLGIIFL